MRFASNGHRRYEYPPPSACARGQGTRPGRAGHSGKRTERVGAVGRWERVAAVLTVVEHLPSDLGCPTNLPLHSRIHRGQRRAVGAVVRVLGCRIVASLGAFLEERGAASEAAGVRGRGGAWSSPWVMLGSQQARDLSGPPGGNCHGKGARERRTW